VKNKIIQKFFKGDLVHIGDLPIYKRHFESNCQAIVKGTYAELCASDKREIHQKEYSLYILPDGRSSAWYDEDQLTFIAADQFLLLPQGHFEREIFEAKQARDLKNGVIRHE